MPLDVRKHVFFFFNWVNWPFKIQIPWPPPLNMGGNRVLLHPFCKQIKVHQFSHPSTHTAPHPKHTKQTWELPKKRAHLQLNLNKIWCVFYPSMWMRAAPLKYKYVNVTQTGLCFLLQTGALKVVCYKLRMCEDIQDLWGKWAIMAVCLYPRKFRHLLVQSDSRNSWTGSHGAKLLALPRTHTSRLSWTQQE